MAGSAAGLSVHPNEVMKYLPSLLASHAVLTQEHAGATYYMAADAAAACRSRRGC